jgi:hypothetical protein
MAGTEFTLDLLGPIILEMRDELRDLKRDVRDVKRDVAVIKEESLPAIEGRMTSHGEEMLVLSAMVMRYSSEPIAWGAMQSEIRILRERLDTLESKC